MKHNFILGTANFGFSYGFSKSLVEQKEISKINKSYNNIKIIDTALKYKIPQKKLNF